LPPTKRRKLKRLSAPKRSLPVIVKTDENGKGAEGAVKPKSAGKGRAAGPRAEKGTKKRRPPGKKAPPKGSGIERLKRVERSASDSQEETGLRASWGTELLLNPHFVPECDSARLDVGGSLGGGGPRQEEKTGGEEGSEGGVREGEQVGGADQAETEGGKENVNSMEGGKTEISQEAQREEGIRKEVHGEEDVEGKLEATDGGEKGEVERASEAPIPAAQEDARAESSRGEGVSLQVETSPPETKHLSGEKAQESQGAVSGYESALERPGEETGQGGDSQPEDQSLPVLPRLKRLKKAADREETPEQSLEQKSARGNGPPTLKHFDEAHRRRVKCLKRGPVREETYGTMGYEMDDGKVQACWVWCECAACQEEQGETRAWLHASLSLGDPRNYKETDNRKYERVELGWVR
jgi:hypothetical protein